MHTLSAPPTPVHTPNTPVCTLFPYTTLSRSWTSLQTPVPDPTTEIPTATLRIWRSKYLAPRRLSRSYPLARPWVLIVGDDEIGRAHVCTPVTLYARTPSSA